MKKETDGAERESQSYRMGRVMYERDLFFVMALNMTWQLAVAVLVPVLGGYYLDQYFGTGPLWVTIGSVLALLGVIGVMVNIYKQAQRKTGAYRPNNKDKDKQ